MGRSRLGRRRGSSRRRGLGKLTQTVFSYRGAGVLQQPRYNLSLDGLTYMDTKNLPTFGDTEVTRGHLCCVPGRWHALSGIPLPLAQETLGTLAVWGHILRVTN